MSSLSETMGICVLFIILAISVIWMNSEDTDPEHSKPKMENIEDVQNNYSHSIFAQEHVLSYQRAKMNLIEEIDGYIDSVAPSSAVNGIIIVDICEKYNFDIKFLLSQAHLESHFGTMGMASKTNSMFNVMAFDGSDLDEILNKGYGYKHPDHSIEPYVKLILKDYLGKDKTEKDLLVNFANTAGNRYASDPDYESKLSNIYINIEQTTNITKLEKIFKKYKIITEI
jgi:flagellum-specific peptidoglycan hydrolase FlgJ